MTPCPAEMDMRAFALAKLSELLAVTAREINSAAADPHADAVHDLRVSIRRLQQGFRLFREFLPGRAVKRIRKQLKRIMERAGELRNYDIALELIGDTPELKNQFEQRRRDAQEQLTVALSEVARPELLDLYRSQLKLDNDEEAVEEAPHSA